MDSWENKGGAHLSVLDFATFFCFTLIPRHWHTTDESYPVPNSDKTIIPSPPHAFIYPKPGTSKHHIIPILLSNNNNNNKKFV